MTEPKKRVLVTGGLGFIGSNLVRELKRRGYDVWACHNMSRSLKLSKDRKNKRNNKFLSSDYIIPLKSLVKEAR